MEFFSIPVNEPEDDTELLVPVAVSAPVPALGPSISNAYSKRNTDKALYFSSERAKTCPLCWKRNKYMVYHFKTQHPNEEVFISRISSKMVDYIAPQNENCRTFIKFIKSSMKQNKELLQTVCIFCEQIRYFSADYWFDHMASHTGEYGNMCEICGKLCSFGVHCKKSATKIDSFDLRHEHLIAYRCNECNFVQRKVQNIRAHLANQHGLYDGGEEHFQVFTLLPAFRSLVRQNDPNEQQQIPGKYRWRKSSKHQQVI